MQLYRSEQLFLNEVYSIPTGKVELLFLGVDDSMFDIAKEDSIKKSFKTKHNIPKDHFIIISEERFMKERKYMFC